MKNPADLTPGQRGTLARTARGNGQLHRGYLMKEQLRQVFAPDTVNGRALPAGPISWASHPKIPESAALAKTLKGFRQLIWNTLDHKLSNGREGINTQLAALRTGLAAHRTSLSHAGGSSGTRSPATARARSSRTGTRRHPARRRTRATLPGTSGVFAPPKGGKHRDVPLGDHLALILSAHVARYPPLPVTLPWADPGGRPVTFPLLFWRRPRPAHSQHIASHVPPPVLAARRGADEP